MTRDYFSKEKGGVKLNCIFSGRDLENCRKSWHLCFENLKLAQWQNMLQPHINNHGADFKWPYLVLASMSMQEFGFTKCVTSAMWTPSSRSPLFKVLTESVSSTSSQPLGSMLNTRWVFLRSLRSRSSSGLTFQGFSGVFTGISHICATRGRCSAFPQETFPIKIYSLTFSEWPHWSPAHSPLPSAINLCLLLWIDNDLLGASYVSGAVLGPGNSGVNREGTVPALENAHGLTEMPHSFPQPLQLRGLQQGETGGSLHPVFKWSTYFHVAELLIQVKPWKKKPNIFQILKVYSSKII